MLGVGPHSFLSLKTPKNKNINYISINTNKYISIYQLIHRYPVEIETSLGLQNQPKK